MVDAAESAEHWTPLLAPRLPGAFQDAIVQAGNTCGLSTATQRQGFLFEVFEVFTSAPVYRFIAEVNRAQAIKARVAQLKREWPKVLRTASSAWRRARTDRLPPEDIDAARIALSRAVLLHNELGWSYRPSEGPPKPEVDLSALELRNKAPKVDLRAREKRFASLDYAPTRSKPPLVSRSKPVLSLDQPSRSTVVTDFVLAPLSELVRRHAEKNLTVKKRPSYRQIGSLILKIARAYLPLAMTRGLNAVNVRSRIEAALNRNVSA
jgi:hypothetical protein